MNLVGWADGAWADGSWVQESWGVVAVPELVPGGSSRKRKRRKVRRFSDELEPVEPEIFVVAREPEIQQVIPAFPALEMALNARRERIKKISRIALLAIKVMDE